MLTSSTLRIKTLSIFSGLVFFVSPLFGQDGSGSLDAYFIPVLLVLVIILFLYGVISVADNLLKVEAHSLDADDGTREMSILPQISDIFSKPLPEYTNGKKVHVLKKGHDIQLLGQAGNTRLQNATNRYAIKPQDFVGMSPIPKVEVSVGDEVLAGDVLFFDKKRADIKYVAPVSGEIVEINRGAKRSIASIVILSDKKIKYKSFDLPSEKADRSQLVSFFAASGLWSHLIERPYNIVPQLDSTPRDIFISTFDSAPLAPDLNLVVEGNQKAFQKGLDILKLLTIGQVHLGLNANGNSAPSDIFTNATGVQHHWFKGAHPAGNVGVQIHHIRPIGTKDKVWTATVQSVVTIGNMFLNGNYDVSRLVAITGNEAEQTGYVKTYQGACVEGIVKPKATKDGVRMISGDVLSGEHIESNGFLGFHDDQLTSIRENANFEMFGWLTPFGMKPTISKAIPSGLFKDYEFEGETNTHGEKRAFVVTGQYEKVLPMDIYVQMLMKNIMIQDFEKMEGLGIYELAEEDVALCEFACTSKMPLQKLLRDGLDLMREQG